ncbi:MAG: 3-oxoacyl-[acyl-carrier-protein] reductase [Alphaproteobacteria bacterium TMED93]|nr:MAG: 3-oxoacyl-[acyl-carrier-protein] reductase [Alphaproteobacteria bacterium TMED93]|tara:strand:- start:347 stop:1087 length:741 start_codon:yes stop_codon:yes gene_type:complete
MNINLEKKNVLVTGGSGGIGSEIVKSIHSLGANILISGSNEQKLENFSNQFNPPLLNYSADLSKKNDIEKLAERTLEKFDNKLDILINNAGITKDNLTLRMKDSEWNDVINLNLNSTFYLTKFFLKYMIKNRYGRIINISSVVGSSGNLGQANYAASKSGIEGMSRSMALEVASRNITINCVAPGFIETEMTKNILSKNEETLIKNIPMGRIGLPDEVASLVSFLASDAAGYITGQTIHINGGLYI